MNDCSSKLISIVKGVGAPLTMEVVKSIARLCSEDPYNLWHEIAKQELGAKAAVIISAEESQRKTVVAELCWRCEACGKTFSDVKHLVNHITYFVRQRDPAHIELYKKVKNHAEKSGKTFSEAAMELLKC